MKWEKGKSGNPSGRPKGVAEVTEAARTYTMECLDTLVDLMRNAKNEKVRVMAADKIWDRAWGKAAQSHEITGPGGEALIPMISVTLKKL